MEKYLFTDGTNVIREVQSKEELNLLIQASEDPSKIRIWIFHSSEWVGHAAFSHSPILKKNSSSKPITPEQQPGTDAPSSKRPTARYAWWKKAGIALVSVGIILLIYNFTRVSWSKAAPLNIVAGRPANTPPLDVDSLIQSLEYTRGQKLEKTTRTNLRIRNTWPERMQLSLHAERDTSREGVKFHNLLLTIDNSTGYNIDEAVAQVSTWEKQELVSTDTIRFRNITYAAPAKRGLEGMRRGDSLSISFSSIRAKTFNFCYAADKTSNYGNLNDRWFCRE